MIILHTEKLEEPQKKMKMDFLDNCLNNNGNFGHSSKPQRLMSTGTSSGNINVESRSMDAGIRMEGIHTLEASTDLGSFVIICNPNAGYYEFSCFDPVLIDFFLKREINIVLWNYRGFGRSKGSCSMKNLLKDAQEIVDLLRGQLGCRSIAIYGRSLGGYIAVNLADKVDLIIADRTFSSIS